MDPSGMPVKIGSVALSLPPVRVAVTMRLSLSLLA
jgi:hypothetical protein